MYNIRKKYRDRNNYNLNLLEVYTCEQENVYEFYTVSLVTTKGLLKYVNFLFGTVLGFSYSIRAYSQKILNRYFSKYHRS
jgi:hypothetical protein